MKRILPFVVVALVTAVAVYAFFGRSKDGALERELQKAREEFAVERQQLEQQLAEARKRPTIVQASAPAEAVVAEPAPQNPEEILAKLRTLRASSRDPKTIRRVIFHLEQLREIGPGSIAPIRAFLNRFEDVDYYSVREEGDTARERGRGDENNRGPRGGGEERDRGGERPRFDPRDFRSNNRFDVRLTFATPPSLRMGLVDVLQSIGGAEAEEALSEMLETTGRAVEVAYVAKTLQEMAPNKYASSAVSAAKDLLLNPAQGAAGDRLDENAKDYLYHVLVMFNDTSFAANAQTILVTADGRIDRQALSYLTQTLKDQAMPAIYQAYLDQRITNQMERASLMNLALSYAGPNQQANQMLNSVISDQNVPSQLKAMALMGLTRGEPDKATLQARIPVVEALKGSTEDERVLRALEFTQQNLQNMIEGKPVEERWRGLFRGGGEGEQQPDQGRGRRGNRGGEQQNTTQQGASPEMLQRYGVQVQQ